MARLLLILAGVSSMAALAAAQCATSDNANCANWKRNGFCTNPGYSKSMLQQYCPNACKAESGCGTPDPVPGTGTGSETPKPEENANCPKWAADKTTMFCASETITDVQKSTFCKKTCAAEVAKTEDCALYMLDGDKIVRSAAVTNDAAPKETGAADPKVIAAMYARTGCTVKLYAANPPADIATPDQEFTGADAKVTAKVEDANKAAASYTCTCV